MRDTALLSTGRFTVHIVLFLLLKKKEFSKVTYN